MVGVSRGEREHARGARRDHGRACERAPTARAHAPKQPAAHHLCSKRAISQTVHRGTRTTRSTAAKLRQVFDAGEGIKLMACPCTERTWLALTGVPHVDPRLFSVVTNTVTRWQRALFGRERVPSFQAARVAMCSGARLTGHNG